MTQAKVYARSSGPQYKRKVWRWPTLLSSAGLVLFTLVYLLPLFYTVATSLKTPLEIAQDPLGFPKTPRFENYFEAASKMNYLRAVLNTVFITAFSSAGIVLLATLAAYPLARVRARWTSMVYQYFAFGLTIPGFVVLIPLYGLMKSLHLVNTYPGLILIYIAGNLPFSIFFFTSFVRSIPAELEEASVLDGCSPLQTFWYVVLPLLRPVVGTVAMFVTLSIWNDFLLPLIFLFSPDSRTVMVSVYSFLGLYGYNPATLFPAAVLGSLPLLIFFFFLQRQIIAGISAGAVKG